MRFGLAVQLPIRILAMAFAFIAISALAGFARADETPEATDLNLAQVAQTDHSPMPSDQRHLEITLWAEENESDRCNRIAKEHNSRLAAISATIGMALTHDLGNGWSTYRFCDTVTKKFRFEQGCTTYVSQKLAQLNKIMHYSEFRECEFGYVSDLSGTSADDYNECVAARKCKEILQKERDIQKAIEVESKRQQEREKELEIARRQAEIEVERIKRENKHRETLAKERVRVAESVRASLESARAAEVAAAEAEQRAKLAREETESQIAEAKAQVGREQNRVEAAAPAKRTDKAKPLFAPLSSRHVSVTVVRQRWKSLSIAELNAICTEVAQRGHNVDIDSWGLWDEHTIYSGKFLAFDEGQFRGKKFRVVCNVMTCAAALANQCDSQGDTAVLIGLIDPMNGKVIHSFSPVRWGH